MKSYIPPFVSVLLSPLLLALPVSLTLTNCASSEAHRIKEQKNNDAGVNEKPVKYLTVNGPENSQGASAPATENCTKATSPYQKCVPLGFVEVDDKGELYSFGQLKEVRNMIKEESSGQPTLVLIFVHGWKNNASEKSGNVREFEKVLTSLAATQNTARGKKIVGVYIGWRGSSYRQGTGMAAVNWTDFYHRYSGGQRVGSGAGTDAIFDITTAARQANQKNFIILCGHSFGAMAVEEALSQPLRAELARLGASGQKITASRQLVPADLVLLLNEAQSAIKSRQLLTAMLNRNVKPDEKDIPLIVSVTSKTDFATKCLFPFGVSMGRRIPPFNLFNTSVSGSYRDSYPTKNEGKQSDAAKITVGNFYPVHSHYIEAAPNVKPPNVNLADQSLAGLPEVTRKKLLSQRWHIRANMKPRQKDKSILIHTQDKGSFTLKRREDDAVFNTTPYWIMQMPKEIGHGHTDIWNERIVGLVTALIYLRSPDSIKAAPPAPKRKTQLPDADTIPLILQLQSL